MYKFEQRSEGRKLKELKFRKREEKEEGKGSKAR